MKASETHGLYHLVTLSLSEHDRPIHVWIPGSSTAQPQVLDFKRSYYVWDEKSGRYLITWHWSVPDDAELEYEEEKEHHEHTS
jgi:hypothetical protein